MSGGFSFGSLANGNDEGTVTGSSTGTTLTSGAANTKGSYTQLVASSPIDSQTLLAFFDNIASNGVELSVDIAIGASGSEKIIIPDIVVNDEIVASCGVEFPVQIPAGSRIAARCQSNDSSDTVKTSILLFDADFTINGFSEIDGYGFVSASTHCTQITPGSSANTKGSWIQLAASITNDLAGFVLGFDAVGQSPPGSGNATNTVLVDIGIGAAGSEIVIIPNFMMIKTYESTAALAAPTIQFSKFFPIPIPAGTRIAARSQSSTTNSNGRLIGVTFYGVRA